MVETVINIRNARPADARSIAEVHDAAWREAYRGIIPGRELEKMIMRRGPRWWETAIRRGSRVVVMEFADSIQGYVSYGPNRAPTLPYQGEIYEIYLAPEYQGLGFGRRLFRTAREDLGAHGYESVLVWALADNDRAVDFYLGLGGKNIREASESFGGEYRKRIAFGFN